LQPGIANDIILDNQQSIRSELGEMKKEICHRLDRLEQGQEAILLLHYIIVVNWELRSILCLCWYYRAITVFISVSNPYCLPKNCLAVDTRLNSVLNLLVSVCSLSDTKVRVVPYPFQPPRHLTEDEIVLIF